MPEAVVGDMKAAAVPAFVVSDVDTEVAETYLPFDMRNKMLEGVVLGTLEEMDPYSAPQAQLAAFAAPERRLAQSIHSFHDRDRWHRGYVFEEAGEILTWAERGMP